MHLRKSLWHHLPMKEIYPNNRAVRSVVTAMKIRNELEMREGSFEDIVRLKRRQIMEQNPDLTSDQVEDALNRTLERAMQPTKPVSPRHVESKGIPADIVAARRKARQEEKKKRRHLRRSR